MTVSCIALGCKVNQYEVRAAAGKLVSAGLEYIPFGTPSDVCIVNTCCVTAAGEGKSRRMISRARRENPDAVLVVTGCLAQLDPHTAAMADLFVPNSDKDLLAQRVLDYLRLRGFSPLPAGAGSSVLRAERTRAVVKVQDGCDAFCSYCIIPYARGPLRSKTMTEAVHELEACARAGYREVVLTGIHLTKYADGDYGLVDLIEAAADVDGVERIRLGSLEPMYFTPERASRMAAVKKLCPHFHISLQSGCDATLSRMNRRYTSAQYMEQLMMLRALFGSAAVTTDVMVGFPGETDSEFAQSIAFVSDCAFAKIHVFPFSPRPGTAAAQMQQVPDAVKTARAAEMSRRAAADRRAFLAAQTGAVLPVLFETGRDGVAHGFASNYVPVAVKCDEELCGQIRNVRIINTENDMCEGVLER